MYFFGFNSQLSYDCLTIIIQKYVCNQQRYQAYKHHWSGTRLPVVLEVGPCALDQLDPSTHTLLASYPYCEIQGVLPGM